MHPSEPDSNKNKSILFVNHRQSNSMRWEQKSFQHESFISNSNSDPDVFENTNGAVDLVRKILSRITNFLAIFLYILMTEYENQLFLIF